MKYIFSIVLSFYSIYLTSQDLPIFNEQLKPGVYANFEEFKNNDPSTTDSLVFEMNLRPQKKWEGTFSVVPFFFEEGKKGKKVKDAWGFSDGKDAFVLFYGEFFKIEISEDSFSFYGYGLPDESYKSHPFLLPNFAGGVSFGVVIMFDQNMKNIKQQYGLGLWKGNIAMLPDFGMKLINEAPDIKLVFFRSGSKKRLSTVNLLINDTSQVNISNESYREINVKVTDAPIKVSLADGTDHIYIKFSNQRTEYIFMSNHTMKGDLVLRLVSHEDGKRFAIKARDKQRKMERKSRKKNEH